MKLMSKLLCCLLAVLLCVSLVACNNQEEPETPVSSESEVQSTPDENNDPVESDPIESEPETSDVSNVPGEDENPDNSEVDSTDENPDNSEVDSTDENPDNSDVDTPVATNKPVVNGTTAKPVVNGTTAKPVVNNTTAKPVVNGTTAKPVVNNTTAKPVVNGTTAKPVVNGTTAKPVVNGTTAKPVVNNTTAKPVVNKTTAKPVVNKTTAKPVVNKTTAKPVVNKTTAKPVVNKTTAKPVVNKTTAKPVVNNTTKAPTNAPAVTTQTPVATTTKRTTKTRGNSDTVKRNITIKSSTTKLEDTVKSKLQGKSYTAIIWTEIKEGFQEELNKFGTQYGCSFKMDSVNFESVGTTLSTKLASGDAYDLIRIQGSWYPRYLTQGLLAPLENAFTTADLVTATNKTGIDLTKSKYFGWNDQLYAITTYDDSPIYYLYYNKSMLSGANDPWTLYQQGNWTWEKMKQVSANFTGPTSAGGAYWSDQSMSYKMLPLSNGVSLLKETAVAGGGVKLEVSISGNTKFINSLKYMQGLNGLGTGTGLYEKKQVLSQDGGSDKFENLLTGKIAVWPSESNRFQKLYASVKTDGTAFGNDVNKLGVAPVPSGVDNPGYSNGYAAGWLTAYAAGKGSDATAPAMVAAFTKFHSTYKFVGTGAIAQEAATAYEAVMKKMYGLYENVNYCDFGYGPTRQENMDMVLGSIEGAVRTGADITSTLKKYDDQAAGYLKNSLSQQ